jgi:hypothetical protein
MISIWNPDKHRNDPDAFSSSSARPKAIAQPVWRLGSALYEDKDHLQPHFRQGGGNLARAAAHADISHALDAGFSNQWHPHG